MINIALESLSREIICPSYNFTFGGRPIRIYDACEGRLYVKKVTFRIKY